MHYLLALVLAMLVTTTAKFPAPTDNRRKADQRDSKNFNKLLHSISNTNRYSPFPRNGLYAIIDEGTDEPFAGKGCQVLKAHDEYRVCSGQRYQVVDVAVTLIDPSHGNKRSKVLVLNRCMYAPDEETLIPDHMMQWAGISVCSKAKTAGGLQRILAHGGHEIPLWTDGKQCYFSFAKVKSKDLKTLPVVTLTPPDTYRPRDYAATSAFATIEQNLSAGVKINNQPTEPDDAGLRMDDLGEVVSVKPRDLWKRRRYLWDATDYHWKDEQLHVWKDRLCAASTEQVKQTFRATTQLVPSVQHENETFPKTSHVARFPMLACRRLREDVHYDKVELSRTSRSVEYGLMFYGKKSHITALYHVGKSITAHKCLTAMWEFTRDYGTPTCIRPDFDVALKGPEWQRYSRLTLCPIKPTEPHKHNKLVERVWGDIKMRKLTYAAAYLVPEERSIDLYQHLIDCHNHRAHKSLKWRTPLEAMDGDTPDISVFRFKFYEPVWFLHGPSQLKTREWMKGRFLGIAWNTGDQMCYRVVEDKKGSNQIFHRSIVVQRFDNESAPQKHNRKPSDFYFPTPKSPDTSVEGRKRKASELAGTPEDSDEILTALVRQSRVARGITGDTTGPVEAAIRAEYLQQCEDNQERMKELSAPPDIETERSVVTRIISWRQAGKPGSQKLKLKVEGPDCKEFHCDLDDLKVDAPITLAKFITDKKNTVKIGKADKSIVKWAQQMIKDHSKFTRLASRLEERTGIRGTVDNCNQGDTPGISIRRHRVAEIKCRRRKPGKPGRNKRASNPMGAFKYGTKVPKNTKQALEIDKLAGNYLWHDAICKEVGALMEMETFMLRPLETKGSIKSKGYHMLPLRCIYDVKQDGRHKARIVIGGHLIDSTGYDTYAGNMKSISARLLMLVAHANSLQVTTGDIRNAYLYATSDMKTAVELGEEFNEYDKKIKVNTIATVEKALYGLPTSANRWHAHLSDNLRAMGFKPSRFDSDIWLKLRDNKAGYDYIGTHTDDLMIVADDADTLMAKIRETYIVKGGGPPTFHLGCDYVQHSDGMWKIGTKTYVDECMKRVIDLLGKKDERDLGHDKVPMSPGLKPELDKSPFCNVDDHRLFQKLIGISQWLITCGRLDLCFAVSSLSRFSAAPREEQLRAATRIFKYLNQSRERWIYIDSRDLVHPGELTRKYDTGKMKDKYPGAAEELDPRFPEPLMKELDTSVYYDSNFAHDEETRRSVSGIVGMVGSTPIIGFSKRQGAIATSTYSAEMCAAKVAAEEVIGIRYALRALGVKLTRPTKMIGDNQGQLDSVTNPGAFCKKKHSQVAFHYVRECEASGIATCYKILTDYNLSDGFTKSLDNNIFSRHYGFLFGWPTTRIKKHRCTVARRRKRNVHINNTGRRRRVQ